MKGLTEVVVWSVPLTAVTLVAISTVSPVETLVAVAAAVAAGCVARRVRLAAGTTPGGGRAAPGALLRLPVSVLHGGAVLCAALLTRTPRARLRHVTLRPGAGAGWAGIVEAFSPDTCVVDVPRDGELLVHTLGDPPGAVERAVAEPADGEGGTGGGGGGGGAR